MDIEKRSAVELCTVIEFQPHRMPSSHSVYGETFSFPYKDGKFRFNLCYENGGTSIFKNNFILCCYSENDQYFPVEVSIIISRGTRSITYPRRTRKAKDGRIALVPREVIWNDTSDAIKLRIPSFDINNPVRFRMIIHDGPQSAMNHTGHKLAQAKPNLLEKDRARWNLQTLQALSEDFSKLLQGGLDFDVEIKCGLQTFKAHKIVLCSRSGFFRGMFHCQMVEAETDVVTLHDVDGTIFREFLKYLYSGRLPQLTPTTAREYYELGDKYDVEDLRKTCAEFLVTDMTPSTACDMLRLADLHSDAYFKERVVDFLLESNAPAKREVWKEFSEQNSVLADEVCRRFAKLFRKK